MKYLFSLFLLVMSYVSIGQVYNPIPQYVYKGKLGVSRTSPVDTSAYFQVGPNGGATAGLLPPRVADTLSILGTKRHGLLIFSNQLDKYAWYDSTNAVWTDIGSGSIAEADAVVLFNGSVSIGDSLLVSNAGGDTAWIKNILLGTGLLAENMGDTVLKINIDSSTVPNIYNSDGTLLSYRTITVPSDEGFLINKSSDGNNTLQFGIENAELFYSVDRLANTKRAGIYAVDNGTLLKLYNYAANGLFIIDNPSIYYPDDIDSIMPYYGVSDTLMYWNTMTGQVQRAMAKNLYNSDGTITGVERQITLDPTANLYIYDDTYSDWWLTFGYDAVTYGNRIEFGPASRKGSLTKSSIVMGSNLISDDSTSSIIFKSSSIINGTNITSNISLDTLGIGLQTMVHYSLFSLDGSANAIMSVSNSQYLLQDLTTPASNRTFRMIPRGTSGYRVTIINESTDGTYKWSFTGTTVIDKDGSTVTAIDDDSVYELLYDGTNWRIINKY